MSPAIETRTPPETRRPSMALTSTTMLTPFAVRAASSLNTPAIAAGASRAYSRNHARIGAFREARSACPPRAAPTAKLPAATAAGKIDRRPLQNAAAAASHPSATTAIVSGGPLPNTTAAATPASIGQASSRAGADMQSE